MVAVMNGENHSSPFRLLHLPRDLLFNCLGRISRLHYPTLSLVSKRLRFLLASKELYAARMCLGRTESCLYMCLTLSPSDKPRWFTLCRRPTQIRNPNSRSPTPRLYETLTDHSRNIKKDTKSSGYLILVSVPTQKDSPACWHDLIAVGSYIYMIGGFVSGAKTSSRVFFMDCRSHTWHKAPSMRKTLEYAYASVLDGKIYVAGGCKSLNLIEFFDLETQKWEHVPKPDAELCWRYLVKSLVIEGKLYLFGDKNVVYKPNGNKWDAVESEMCVNWNPNSYYYCVIDNVLYYYGVGFGLSTRFKWYDSEEKSWRDLEGLEGLPELRQPYSSVRLVNSGGKIAVFWDENIINGCVIGFYETKIWYAEIAVERRSEYKIYGKVEWCDVVHTVPKTCKVLQVIAVTL